jgi:TolB-like protein/Tfp pilus assembly protein PilF
MGVTKAPTPASSPELSSNRLDSWKEIAAYLKRDERTVRRWENEGLPVHRHVHKKQASIYAYRTEIDSWWTEGRSRLEQNVPPNVYRRLLPWLITVGLAALVVILALTSGRLRNPQPTAAKLSRIESLAVLPFEDLSHDPGQEYFADGMTDELINRLAQVNALRVVSRTSVMQFRGSSKPLSTVAKALNVDAVLEGAVLRSGGRARITAELIDARSDKQLWAHSYEGDIGDVLKLQSNMAEAITREIQVAVTAQEQQRIISARRVDPDALDAYLHGKFFWDRFSEEGMHKAVEYFQKAIDKEPEWAAAYAAQAHAYHELSWYQPPEQVVPKARWAAEKAIQLDPNDSDAYAALAWVKWVYDWDWQGAETDFKHAIELQPNNALAHAQYALFLDCAGRGQAALDEEHLALRLDPLSLILNSNLGDILADNHQTDQAIQQYLKTIRMDPQFAAGHAGLAIAYASQQRFQDAIREMQTELEYDSNSEDRGWFAWIFAVSGQKERARQTLRELDKISKHQYIPASSALSALVALGEREKALAALEKAVQERESNLAFIREEPTFSSLSSDPRFERVLRAIRLP